ncbi:MAG: hypothetical protein NWQ16_09540 [Akkermansiaceae bacterium]|nr:hypothetical protein [Akkermansiaceae bacterium]
MTSLRKFAIFGPVTDRLDISDLKESCFSKRHAVPGDLAQNNADVIILSGKTLKYAARFRTIKHVQQVWVPKRDFAGAVICFGRYVIQGRMAYGGVETLGGRSFLVFNLKDKKHRGISNRIFYPADIPPKVLLQGFTDHRFNYVLLRWQDHLDTLPADEDLDLLVSDDDALLIKNQLNARIGTRPLDLHTVSGTVKNVSDGLAYFPPHLSKELLESKKENADRIYIPNPKYHLLSFIYHTIYQKGDRSKVESGKGNRFYDQIDKLMKAEGVEFEITLENLDSYLETQGWKPAFDTLAKLSTNNTWLRDRLMKQFAEIQDTNITVFIFREVVEKWGNLQDLVKDIRDSDFKILREGPLDKNEVPRIAQGIRGGDWSQGNWPTDGGFPYYAVLVQDPMPVAPNSYIKKKSPFITNARPNLFKEKWRKKVNSGFPAEGKANFVHCSDSELEAYEYIQLIFPGEGEKWFSQK